MTQSSAIAERIQTVSPVDESIYVERSLETGPAIEAKLNAAVTAQKRWRQVPLADRAQICRGAVAWMAEHAEQMGTELSWQMGRPIRYSPNEIRRGFQERALYMIDVAEQELADLPCDPKENFQRFIRRDPVGVVLAIMPWNYPYLCSVNVVWPAIVAGNSVILKPATQTPLTAEHYAQAFAAAGLPEGVFQFLHASHDDVSKLIRDQRINFVAFTGSVSAGHSVQRVAGERFIGTGLELGGKDPAYVRPDAFLDRTIEELVDGVFFNSGQSCCAVERIYVHQDVWKRFVDGFVELTNKYVLDDPLKAETTLGPMVHKKAATSVRTKIAEAIQKGAKPLIDPSRFPKAVNGTAYVAPQVLINVDHNMSIVMEETFGPVAPIMQVKTDEEAIRLMNDSQYGLSASVWTADKEAAMKIGNQIETGTWYMNRCDYLDPALAWTGVKDSGHGCTLSKLGYASVTQPKSFHLRFTL